jgi:hypothetical protein
MKLIFAAQRGAQRFLSTESRKELETESIRFWTEKKFSFFN